MLFCSNCGGPVNPGDAFCGKCGTRQPGAAAPPPSAPRAASAGDGLSPSTASTLCYIPWFGWLAAIYVLAAERFRRERDARFHAFQGLYLFVVWLIVDRVVAPIFRSGFLPGIGWPLRLAIIGTGIYMAIKTSQGQRVLLPVIGELAEKSANEQN
ncbi:MAG: hypothetical protein K2X03_19535 [Bryobacteraceae bacterium]|nr:hypothetical protein [Bryobacteraceae bacterium]